MTQHSTDEEREQKTYMKRKVSWQKEHKITECSNNATSKEPYGNLYTCKTYKTKRKSVDKHRNDTAQYRWRKRTENLCEEKGKLIKRS